MPDPTTTAPFAGLPILGELGASLDAAFAREATPEELAAAGAPVAARRTRRWHFPGFLGTLAFLTVGVSTAAATLTVLTGSPIPAPRSADLQPPMTVDPGSARVLALRAADPLGGPPFALRIGRSQAGLTCSTVGQVAGGQFGVVGFDGRFRPMPPQAVDGCGEASAAGVATLGARTFDDPDEAKVRTVLYAVGGGELRTAEATIRGAERQLPVDGDGNVLVALRGYPEDNGLRVTLHFRGGRTVVEPLGTGFGAATDPVGPAWRLSASGGTTGTCVEVLRLRPSLTTPRLPQACGRWTSIHAGAANPWFFDIRRFSGADHGSTRPFGQQAAAWAWHGADPRTMVWGAADPKQVRAVVATGDGLRAEATPTINGAFLVVLPRAIPAADVRVEMVMKDGARRAFDGPTGLAQLQLPKVTKRQQALARKFARQAQARFRAAAKARGAGR